MHCIPRPAGDLEACHRPFSGRREIKSSPVATINPTCFGSVACIDISALVSCAAGKFFQTQRAQRTQRFAEENIGSFSQPLSAFLCVLRVLCVKTRERRRLCQFEHFVNRCAKLSLSRSVPPFFQMQRAQRTQRGAEEKIGSSQPLSAFLCVLRVLCVKTRERRRLLPVRTFRKQVR